LESFKFININLFWLINEFEIDETLSLDKIDDMKSIGHILEEKITLLNSSSDKLVKKFGSCKRYELHSASNSNNFKSVV
jgi:hypothetical protein